MERDPLRSISQTGVFVLFYLLAITATAPLLYWVGGQMVETTVTPLLGALAATFLCVKIYDEAALPHVGLRFDSRGGRDLWMGTAAGMVCASLAVLPGIALHLAHFTPVAGVHADFNTTSFATILIFCGACGEEMLFHGFAFQSLMNGLGPFAAIFPVGVIFGLLHMGNPYATWLSTLNTVGFGIIFGCALYQTRALWLPIGLHFGWNIALPFLGTKISGLTIRVTGYEMTWNAGPLWSGGAYGPEGSLLTTVVLVVMLLFIWRYPFPYRAAQVPRPEEGEPVS
jgi:hypothetical protein